MKHQWTKRRYNTALAVRVGDWTFRNGGHDRPKWICLKCRSAVYRHMRPGIHELIESINGMKLTCDEAIVARVILE